MSSSSPDAATSGRTTVNGAPATTAGDNASASGKRHDFEVLPVRRSDVRRLAQTIASPDHDPSTGRHAPDKHGGENDPRYRRRQARRTISFVLDLAIHLGAGAGAGYALHQLPQLAPYSGFAIPAAIGVFALASLVDRIFVQWAFRATVGKLLTGLRMIRDDTGGRPTLWSLVKDWLSSVAATLAMVLNN